MKEHPKTTTKEFALVYDALEKASKEVVVMLSNFVSHCS
jgi:hypothetical protein